MKNTLYKIKIFFILSLLSLPVKADTILLKNKPSLKGKILTINDELISIETDKGIVNEPKKNILKLLFSDVTKEEEDKIREEELKKISASESTTSLESKEAAKIIEPTKNIVSKNEDSAIKNNPNPIANENSSIPPKEKKSDYAIELASDFIFRGQSFGGHNQNSRSNSSYRSYTDAWAIQPSFTYNTPINGFKFLFWGNVFLQHSRDRDSDWALQVAPSERDQGSEVLNMLNSGRTSTGSLDYDPSRLNFYKEKNGLHRQNGAFTGAYYEWETTIGIWSAGLWTWNNADKSNKYTWQEFFVWYKPSLLPYMNPMLQAYWNASSDHGGNKKEPQGITNGQNYFSVEMSHEYFKGDFFRLTPNLHTGYIVNNNNIDQRSGISNITSSLKLNFGNLFCVLNHIYRPETDVWDTDDKNRRDGKTPDPSKQNGIYSIARTSLQKQYGEAIGGYLSDQNSNQAINKVLYYISFGYENKF
jgi:hypothetical protein